MVMKTTERLCSCIFRRPRDAKDENQTHDDDRSEASKRAAMTKPNAAEFSDHLDEFPQ